MSKLDDLEKLNNLKENGAITLQEFEQEKQKILNVTEVDNTNENVIRLDIIGIMLSIYSIIYVIASLYAYLGIFVIDLLVSTIISVTALFVSIKAKKQLTGKSKIPTVGIVCSIIAIILLLPFMFDFITKINLYY